LVWVELIYLPLSYGITLSSRWFLKLVRKGIKVLKLTIYWVKGELVDYYGLRYAGGVLWLAGDAAALYVGYWCTQYYAGFLASLRVLVLSVLALRLLQKVLRLVLSL
jgi:hypothetical protein